MSRHRRAPAVFVVALAFVSGCGTPREKTAPCKRPANLASYADAGNACGPMARLNADRAAALAAIAQMADARQE